MDIFLSRLQATLQQDVTISAWNGDRVIVEEDPEDDEALAFAATEPTMILIHTPRHRESQCPEHPQQIGRECSRFQVTITTVQRAATGVDPSQRTDPAVTGQPGMPGVVKMQADVHNAFNGPTGVWNLLPDASGENYLWWLEIGEAGEPLPIDGEDSTFVTSSREIVGHRWRPFY